MRLISLSRDPFKRGHLLRWRLHYRHLGNWPTARCDFSVIKNRMLDSTFSPGTEPLSANAVFPRVSIFTQLAEKKRTSTLVMSEQFVPTPYRIDYRELSRLPPPPPRRRSQSLRTRWQQTPRKNQVRPSPTQLSPPPPHLPLHPLHISWRHKVCQNITRRHNPRKLR